MTLQSSHKDIAVLAAKHCSSLKRDCFHIMIFASHRHLQPIRKVEQLVSVVQFCAAACICVAHL